MTNVTERIKQGSINAIKYLENGDSVRRACQKAGISVTSLYHTTTPEQREQAYLKNVSDAPAGLSSRKSKRRKVRSRPTQKMSESSDDVIQLQKELRNAYDYIAKLEHKLVKSIVFSEAGQ